MVTISQRPSEEEAEVGGRNEGMKEEKGGPGTGLRSYIEKPSSRQDPFGSVYGWINKSIHHHHHHSTARRAKYAAHAKCAKQGAQRLRASIMILRHWGVLQKVHIEECKVLQA